MPVQDEAYKDALRAEQKLRHALATIVNALDAMGEHANLVRIGQTALADDCSSCDGSGSGGLGIGCTDCLGTGIDPSSVAGALPCSDCAGTGKYGDGLPFDECKGEPASEAFTWLQKRGYAVIETDDSGAFARIVREPVPTNSTPTGDTQ